MTGIMGLLERVPCDELIPARIWAELDAESRRLAAVALYRGERADGASRREADRAIAAAMRFRESAVQKLSADRRVSYLLQAVRPDDSLASSLLLALHLEHRRDLLQAFLNDLGIANDRGMIEGEFEPPPAERLAPAIEAARDRFPAADVELYLACLLALDADHWSGLRESLEGSAPPG